MPSTRGSIPRRIYTRKEQVGKERHGLTVGRNGCEAANRGTTKIHNEGCRERIEKESFVKDLQRLDKVVNELSTHETKKIGESQEVSLPHLGNAEDIPKVTSSRTQEDGS